MTAAIPPILLVGLGKMGGAMLAGWRERGLAAAVAVDPALPAAPGPEVTVVADASGIPKNFAPAAVVLAVKPQNAAATLPHYARYAASAVFLSIMAGRTVAGIRALVGEQSAVVRAMPNTPAAIRQGISVGFAGPGVGATQRALCDDLLQAIGKVAWVSEESLIDPVTAVSGSGPAYVFLLAELMERAAVEQGIPPDLGAMTRAVENGVGIAVLPDYVVAPESGLVRLLPQADMPEMDCFLVYAEELKNVARVQAFRDFLVRTAQRWRY